MTLPSIRLATLLIALTGLAAAPAVGQQPAGVIQERVALENDSVRVSFLTFPPGSIPGIQQYSDLVLDHSFDLLGSGPIKITKGVACPGFQGINYSHKGTSDEKHQVRINRANLLGRLSRIDVADTCPMTHRFRRPLSLPSPNRVRCG